MMRVLHAAKRVGWKAPVVILTLAVAGSAPWWGRRVLSRLSYFQVRQVEVYGGRYLQPRDVLARLHVDTTTSVWTDLGALERRVATLPQVRRVQIERKLPGTLVVHITENLPVAFVPVSARGLRAVDAGGRVLPIDPTRVNIDLPVLPRPDVTLLRLLADVRRTDRPLFDQISSAQRVGLGGRGDEITIALDSVLVRAPATVTAARLADIIPVEHDLARKHERAAELDLRYRDQVIARLQ